MRINLRDLNRLRGYHAARPSMPFATLMRLPGDCWSLARGRPSGRPRADDSCDWGRFLGFAGKI